MAMTGIVSDLKKVFILKMIFLNEKINGLVVW
jgi:hypothetical protein